MRIIAIDQSTSATKALLFDEQGMLIGKASREHKQYYPQSGWVEHDPEEIYQNTIAVIKEIVDNAQQHTETAQPQYSIAITNQRETVVVWDKRNGKPVCNAVVWQCMRGTEICEALKAKGYNTMVQEKSGLFIDPYFAGSGAKWILDNVPNARKDAEDGHLLMGTIDSWLIWKLTEGKVHATDYTNASRTLLFNIHTLDWDDELLTMLTIPRCMMPKALPCDAVYGETTADGIFSYPIQIAGVLGDSHGALAGQMCFTEGLGKVTYGTGSSVMVNIGEHYSPAPTGLVTSVGFSALGKTFYAFEGNIHCTGATIKWIKEQMQIIDNVADCEQIATSVTDNGGVYLIPAFAGLGAPWWKAKAKGAIVGLTLSSTKAHVVRAAVESIAFQVTDLVKTMTDTAGIELKEIRADGGPTKNQFLMQLQSDLLKVPVVKSDVEDASAFGAFVMNGFARKQWTSFEEAAAIWKSENAIKPQTDNTTSIADNYANWRNAVMQVTGNQ